MCLRRASSVARLRPRSRPGAGDIRIDESAHTCAVLERKGSHRSVGEAAQGADVLITMLPDGEVVREVVLEALLQLKPPSTVGFSVT